MTSAEVRARMEEIRARYDGEIDQGHLVLPLPPGMSIGDLIQQGIDDFVGRGEG